MIGANTLDWFSLESRESTSPIFPGDMNTDDFTSGLQFSGFGTSPLDIAKFSDFLSEALSLDSGVGLGNAGWDSDGICDGFCITGKVMRVGPPGGVEVQVADEDWEFSFSESPIFALSGIPEKTANNKKSVKYLSVLQKEI